jgi:hypothetical protein
MRIWWRAIFGIVFLAQLKQKLQGESFEDVRFNPIRFEGIDPGLRLIRPACPEPGGRDWVKSNYAGFDGICLSASSVWLVIG